MDVPLCESPRPVVGNFICKKIFPTGFKEELKGLLEIFFPCLFTNLFRFMNPLISSIMCGHLSKLEFDAVLLASSIINIFGGTIDLGFSTAFDTLFAQTYGSDNKKKMGALLQRAIIITTLLYLILACFHMNIEPFLIWCKQDPLISELTTLYVTIYLPGLFFDFQFLTISRYLQNQNIVYPMMISALVSNIFNATSQYIALFVYGYGIRASAIILTISTVLMFALQLGYVILSKVYNPTWDGFGWRKALENWKIIFLLGIPGIFMISLKGWNFEIITFVAGALSDVQLGAHGIALQCATIAFMLTIGLSIAVTIRVGQYLGSRDIDRLKTFLRTVALVGTILSTVSFAVVFCLRDVIVTYFSNDRDIQREASSLLIYVSFFLIIDVLAFIYSAILKSCARQAFAAVIMFVCDYIIGTPVGLLLVFRAHSNIQGMWIGMIIAVFLEAVIFAVLVHKIDWETECDKARLNTGTLDTYDEAESQPLLAEKIDFVNNYYWSKRTNLIKDAVKAEESNSNESFTKIAKLRCLTISVIVSLFAASVLIRIFTPKSLYLPCLPMTNQTLMMYSNNLDMLCKTHH